LGAFKFQCRDPCLCKSRHDAAEAEIFYETASLAQNTVNGGFPVRGDVRKVPAIPAIAPGVQFD